MPTNESQFAVPMTTPFLSSSGRCWIEALTGTMKNPPKNPSAARSKSTARKDKWGIARQSPRTVMPIEPSGISPYSIFPAER